MVNRMKIQMVRNGTCPKCFNNEKHSFQMRNVELRGRNGYGPAI